LKPYFVFILGLILDFGFFVVVEGKGEMLRIKIIGYFEAMFLFEFFKKK